MSNMGKAICEALMYRYKDLEARCERIDHDIKVKARGSRNKDIYEVYDEIMRLTNEKIACINAKVIIDDALDRMLCTTEIRAQLNKEDDDIGQGSERTERKKQKLAQVILDKYGVPKLLDLICDSQWLMNEVGRRKRRLDRQERENNTQT